MNSCFLHLEAIKTRHWHQRWAVVDNVALKPAEEAKQTVQLDREKADTSSTISRKRVIILPSSFEVKPDQESDTDVARNSFSPRQRSKQCGNILFTEL